MPTRNIVVIGASTGGIEALGKVLEGLPADFPATVFIVQHTAATSGNHLPGILDRMTDLSVTLAVDAQHFAPGQIYVAPADYHLLIDHKQMYLSRGPRENRTRPAIDPLFRSAALCHDKRSIGVILTGALDDGTAGLVAINKSGGLTVVQDPDTAVMPDMPRFALEQVDVDHCEPVAEIGPLLNRLVREELGDDFQFPLDPSHGYELQCEIDILRRQSGTIDDIESFGELEPASCPECGGPLWRMHGKVPRYRCHTGHAFSARHLIAGLEVAEEEAFWAALRVLEERIRLLRRLAKKGVYDGSSALENSYTAHAEEAERHARILREMLIGGRTNPETGCD